MMSRMELRKALESLRPRLAEAAQAVIDAWEQDAEGWDEEYGEGGPCDDVASALSEAVYNAIPGVEVVDGGHDGDDHAYIIVYDESDAFAVDVPPHVYESGGGYSWQKLEGASVTADDVIIEPVDRRHVVLAAIAHRIAAGQECEIVAVGENGDADARDELGIDPWDAADRAEALFRQQDIRLSSYESVAFAAVCGGEIVGAASFGVQQDEGGPSYTFSVAVDGAWQKKGLGRKLVQRVVEEARSQEQGGRFRVWVVNPNMARLLESMGFETDGREWTESSPHMYLDL